MTVLLPPPALAEVVSRLRSAGCVFAEDEAALLLEAASTADEVESMLQRRTAGLPLEQVVGWAEFWGMRIAVSPGVFVPRRRTEFLVECALARAGSPAVVVDLCCGTGALGAAVGGERPEATLYAVDIDEEAVACARRNLDGRGTVLQGDLFDPLPRELVGRVDLVLANVPYVPTGHLGLLPPEARLHERHRALDGGIDGLDLLRRVVGAAPRWLAPGAPVLFEITEAQSPAAESATTAAGLVPDVMVSDTRETCVLVARRPALS